MKQFRRLGALILTLAVALAFVAGKVAAQEHPQEHPKEHPTAKKTDKKAQADVSMADLSAAIKNYVAKDAELKGGYYLVYDPVNKKTLELTLDKVHEERLSKVVDGVYFACADFKASDGKIYDLDIFMKGDKSKLQVNEVTIHKEAGNPRYGWVEENGVWQRKTAESAK